MGEQDLNPIGEVREKNLFASFISKQEKMRVLQYNWVFPPHPFSGGRANVCRYYSRFLAMRGHEVTVFTTKCKEVPSRTEENNIKVIRAGFCYSGNRVTDYGKNFFNNL